MYCSNCGAEVSGNFCQNCGNPVGNNNSQNEKIVSGVSNAQSQQNNLDMQKRPAKASKKWGCLNGIAILIIFFIAMNLFFFKSDTSPEKKDASTSKEEAKTLSKEEARSIDEEVWSYVINVMKVNNSIMETMMAYSDGTATELDLYNLCKDNDEYFMNAWGSLSTYKNKDASTYAETVKDYIITEQVMVESILKYLDTKKTSDLSVVEENIERCSKAVETVAQNRGVFLNACGFSDKEIQELIDKIDEELGE